MTTRFRDFDASERGRLLAFGVLVVIAFILLSSVAMRASAAPPPKDGPVLAGTFTDDGMLIVPWYYDATGASRPLRDGSTLETNELHVFIATYPGARVNTNSPELTFIWEQPQEVTHEVDVNGTLETRTTTEWEENLTLSFTVSALKGSVQDTVIELPSVNGDRLTIMYGDVKLAQVTHDTNDALLLLPRQTRQDAWQNDLSVLVAALAVTAIAVGASRRAYKAAGGYVPPLELPFWVALGIGLTATGYGLWISNREGLVLRGVLPLLLVYGAIVFFLALQFWRSEPNRWYFCRVDPSTDTAQPLGQLVSRVVPANPRDDAHPSAENADLIPYIQPGWKGWWWRLLGTRTFLRVNPRRRWHIDLGDDERLYFLHDYMPAPAYPRVRVERVDGFPWYVLRIDREIVQDVPVSPWAYKESVIDVVSALIEQERIGERMSKLQSENADLKAALKAGTAEKARTLMDTLFLRMRAVRLGVDPDDAADEHREITRAGTPHVRAQKQEATPP